MAISSKKLFDKYLKKMNGLNKDKNIEDIFSSLLNGKNSYLRLSRKGSSSFDPTWIDVIEDCMFDLGEIVNNPREVTKTDSSVTPIELAKKVNGESVQHLASHTQFIKEVNEKGEVVPSKILSHFNVEEIKTYENRFIATFIRQLLLFIEKRYGFIQEQIDLTKDEVMYIKNKSIVNGQEVEIESKITIKKELEDSSSIQAKEYIERIKTIREYVSYYYNSPFMKMMRTERNVRRPILQTNIIRKNPKYHKCYETFLFIERFDSLGVSYHVDEDYKVFSEEERKEINYLLLSNYLSVQDPDEYDTFKENKRTYKPKVLTSIDDEKFIYGDYFKGPIEFVRIDEEYQRYLQSKVNRNLPLDPNKYEYEYYKEDYDYKYEQSLDESELNLLINRKKEEIAEFEKEIERIIKERDFEEAEQKRKELEALRRYELELIEIRRKKIIEAALENRPAEEEVSNAPLFAKGNNDQDVLVDQTPTLDESLFDIPEELVGSETNASDVNPQSEEEKLLEAPIMENKVEVTPSTPSTDLPEVAVADVETPIEDIPVEEEKPVEEKLEEAPIEEQQVEEKPHKEEIVYVVSGDSEIVYVDGHKEERFISASNDDSDDEEEEVYYEVEEPQEDRFVIKALNGYYVAEHKYSQNIEEAFVYTNEEEAKAKRKILGGKVIKL